MNYTPGVVVKKSLLRGLRRRNIFSVVLILAVEIVDETNDTSYGLVLVLLEIVKVSYYTSG